MRKLIGVLVVVVLLSFSGLSLAAEFDLRAYEGRTLNLLLKEGYEIDVIVNMIQDFEADTGVNVKIEIYDEPTTRQKFVFDVTSQAGAYDVTSVSFWHWPEYYRNEWLLPLNEYFVANDHPWNFHYEDIPESALDMFSGDDNLYAMPHTIIGGAFYYRTDIFEEHGLTPPKSTADVLSLAKEIAELDIGIYPIIGRGVADFSSAGTYAGWAWTYGATILDEDLRPQINSPKMKDALNDYVAMLRDYGPPGVASMNFNDIGQMFYEGNVAMMFDTSGWGGMVNNPDISQVAGNVGITNVEGPTGEHLQWIYMEGLSVNRYSKNKDVAALFLKWRMSRDTTYREALELRRWDVPNLYVMEQPEYKQVAIENFAGEYVDYLPIAWENATAEYWPLIPAFAPLGDALMVEISAALAGDKSIESALNSAQTSVEAVLKRAGY